MIAKFDSMRRGYFVAAGIALSLLLGCATRTRPQPSAPPSATAPAADTGAAAGPPVTRIYDIRSLLIEIPDFDDVPDLSLAPTTQPAVPPPHHARTREQRVQQLIDLIEQTVAPDSWGSACNIRELAGQLVVTQTPDHQALVERLVGQLIEKHDLQITVEARFVLIDDATVEKFGLTKAGNSTTFLDAAQVDLLLRAVQEGKDSRVVTAPRITLFNGQRAYVAVMTQRAYVSGYQVRDGKDGARTLEPKQEIATVDSGLVLDVMAAASADQKYVTLTLRPELSRLERMEDAVWPNSPAGTPLKIQVPTVTVRKLNKTVSFPAGGTIVLGGWSDLISQGPDGGTTQPASKSEPAPAQQGDLSLENSDAFPWGDRKNANLYVMVKAVVISGAGNQGKSFPLLKTKIEAR